MQSIIPDRRIPPQRAPGVRQLSRVRHVELTDRAEKLAGLTLMECLRFERYSFASRNNFLKICIFWFAGPLSSL